jgi:hypothetical protein
LRGYIIADNLSPKISKILYKPVSKYPTGHLEAFKSIPKVFQNRINKISQIQ